MNHFFLFAIKDNSLVGQRGGKFVGFVKAKSLNDAKVLAKFFGRKYEAFGFGCPLPGNVKRFKNLKVN